MSIRWNPRSPQLHTNMSQILNELIRQSGQAAEGGEEEVAQSTFTPAVDVKETDDALTLFAEIPGVHKDDIDISLENNTLTVSGERRFPQDEEEHYRRIERIYGKFSRSFRLPRDVDPTRVSAAYEEGVLRLDLPKVEAAKPRQIKIA